VGLRREEMKSKRKGPKMRKPVPMRPHKIIRPKTVYDRKREKGSNYED
jgi:hypothetical protein